MKLSRVVLHPGYMLIAVFVPALIIAIVLGVRRVSTLRNVTTTTTTSTSSTTGETATTTEEPTTEVTVEQQETNIALISGLVLVVSFLFGIVMFRIFRERRMDARYFSRLNQLNIERVMEKAGVGKDAVIDALREVKETSRREMMRRYKDELFPGETHRVIYEMATEREGV